MATVKSSNGKTFEVLAGRTILESAEKSKINLPYSCRVGRCSACKCKVISGDTVPLVDEVGLMQKEKDEGWILTCVRSATSNLEIEIDDLSKNESNSERNKNKIIKKNFVLVVGDFYYKESALNLKVERVLDLYKLPFYH